MKRQQQHPSALGARAWWPAAIAVALLALGLGHESASAFPADASGEVANPDPIRLKRPTVKPPTAIGRMGKKMFFDPSLSASGRVSCATCHSASTAYGPPNRRAVQPGGPAGNALGTRAAPSLVYLLRTPNFSIGPDDPSAENVDVVAMASQFAGTSRPQKTAGLAPDTLPMVPQGGLFWDGRANTFERQAMGPLLSPFEMANHDVEEVSRKLEHGPYGDEMRKMFGPRIFADPHRAVDEAMFAIARFQVEDPSFHPYSSKYDAYLEGKASLSAAEYHGLQVFNDRNGANCAGCHLSRPGKDGLPPLFTDFQYEALGVPRNPAIPANRDPGFFDLGLCGPIRGDLSDQKQYCGMFRTPSLRNTALRPVYFHNGRYSTLEQVLDFYDLRDTQPEKIYPHGRKFNDLPVADQANVDVTDPPFNRTLGQAPVMTKQDRRDLIAFLKTLNDGYQSDQAKP